MSALNEFISGAIWLAAIVALGFTGTRAMQQGHFRAVSESYYGRKAQNLGLICLVIGIIAAVLFLRRLLTIATAVVVFRQLPVTPVFFLLGAAFGGYLTYRYYIRAV